MQALSLQCPYMLPRPYELLEILHLYWQLPDIIIFAAQPTPIPAEIKPASEMTTVAAATATAPPRTYYFPSPCVKSNVCNKKHVASGWWKIEFAVPMIQ